MSPVSSVQQVIRRHEPLAEPNLGRVAQVDHSLAPAALLLSVLAALWLLASSLLGLVASLQLHLPELVSAEALTYGRVRDLQSVLLHYGWSANAALAVGLWVAHRLGRVESRHAWVAVLGTLGWNLALAWGCLSLLGGGTTGLPSLELPRETGPFMVACFLAVGLWAAVAFSRRHTPHVFAAQWHVLAAVLSFPVLHLLAHAAIHAYPSDGVLQAIVAAWHAHGFLGLFLAPVALAAIYYLIPKETGRPIRGYYLATVAFWLFVTLHAWAGAAHLLGSPVPAWIQSSGVVAAIMLLVPAIIAAINFQGTLWQAPRGPRSPSLRFAAAAAHGFLLWILAFVLLSTRTGSARFRFTELEQAQGILALHGFVALALFAGLYYLLPRVTRREWPSQGLVAAHYWLCLLGTSGAVLALGALGWLRAEAPADLAQTARVLNAAASVSFATLLLGHLAFVANLAALLTLSPRPRGVAPLSVR